MKDKHNWKLHLVVNFDQEKSTMAFSEKAPFRSIT